MKRGDIVVVAVQGDYGKPRPAVIVQNNAIELDSVVISLITFDLQDAQFRITLEPSVETGLQKISQVMIDKIMTIPKAKIGKIIGEVPDDAMKKIEQALILLFGLAH